ncbi:MAG: hypothetical protein RL322_630 [Pseudomonadota bacterium]
MVQSARRSCPLPPVTGLVLCGGQGRRMSPDGAGIDKAFVTFRGRPLVQHVIERMTPQVDTLILNTPSGPAWDALGCERVSDRLGTPNQPIGPLAGIHAGLKTIRTNWLVCTPCDTPFLPRNMTRTLFAEQKRTDAMAVGVRCEGRLHPILCLLHRGVVEGLERFIDGGGRRVEDWLRTIPAAWCAFPNAESFINLNTRAELEAMERP